MVLISPCGYFVSLGLLRSDAILLHQASDPIEAARQFLFHFLVNARAAVPAANIRVLNRIELVGETMRRVLDDIAQITPDWLKPLIQPEWGKRYGRKGFPPSRKMVASPDELEARYGSKDGMTWTGYKIHITETCDEDSPRLITHVETTVATTTDGSATEKIQDELIEQGLSPESHWVDGGYADVNVLLNSQKKGIDLIGPMHQDSSWQTKVEGGYN